jgi:hypothetical protein
VRQRNGNIIIERQRTRREIQSRRDRGREQVQQIDRKRTVKLEIQTDKRDREIEERVKEKQKDTHGDIFNCMKLGLKFSFKNMRNCRKNCCAKN